MVDPRFRASFQVKAKPGAPPPTGGGGGGSGAQGFSVSFATTAEAQAAQAAICAAKYGKAAVLMYDHDDGGRELLTQIWPFLKTLTYTDGAGGTLTYRATGAIFGQDTAGVELHNGANPGKYTWPEMLTMLGWGGAFANHSWNHTEPDAAGQVAKLDALAKLRFAALGSAYQLTNGIVPSSYPAYPQAFFDAGYRLVSSQGTGGGYPLLPLYVEESFALSELPAGTGAGTRLVLRRDLLDPNNEPLSVHQARLDALLSGGTVASPRVYRTYSHQDDPTLLEAFFTYARQRANDRLWMPSLDEFADYLDVRRATTLVKTVSGTTATWTLSRTLPATVRYRDVSVWITGGTIKSVAQTGGQAVSANASTGLVNFYDAPVLPVAGAAVVSPPPPAAGELPRPAYIKRFILMRGDSITYSVNEPRGQDLASLLQNELGTDYYEVYNAGVSSQTTASLLPDLVSELNFHWRSQYRDPALVEKEALVLWMSGTNDPVQGKSVDQSMADFAQIRAQLDPLGVPFMLSSCVERMDTGNIFPAFFEDLNTRLAAKYQDLGAKSFCNFRGNNHLNKYQAGLNDDYWRSSGGVLDRIHWGTLANQEYVKQLAAHVRWLCGAPGAVNPMGATPAPGAAYVTNTVIPFSEAMLFQKNNITTQSLYPAFTLMDGNPLTEFHPSNATMFFSPHEMVFDARRFGLDFIPRQIKLVDKTGSWPGTPTTFHFRRRDNGQLTPALSWGGEGYSDTPQVFDVPAVLQTLCDQFVVRGAGISEYPPELQVIGDYALAPAPAYARPATAFKFASGINGYPWYVQQDDFDPAHADTFLPKLDLICATFPGGFRCFITTEYSFPAPGQLAFEPLFHGWKQDTMMKDFFERGVLCLLTSCNMPKWMQAQYPAGYGDATHPDDYAFVRYADVGRRDQVSAYPDAAYLAKHQAARYGHNPNADTSDLVLWQSPNTYEGTNMPKKALGYTTHTEHGNEEEKDWRKIEGHATGEQFAAKCTATYNAVKAADPTMQVVMPGLGVPLTDVIKVAYYWRKANGYVDAQGNVTLPWDVHNFHFYPSSAGSSQYGGTGAGHAVAADSDPLFAWVIDKHLTYSNRYGAGKPIWITESGVDLNAGSPLSPPPVPGKTPQQVQGDVIARNALFYKEKGIDRVFWYQGFDEDYNSAGQFASCGLLDAIQLKDAAGTVTGYRYQRRPAARYLFQMNSFMGEATFAGMVSETSSARVSRWALPAGGGGTVYAARLTSHSGATGSYTLTGLPAGVVAQLYTLNPGAEVPASQALTVSSAGTLVLALGETPTFLKVAAPAA